MTDRAYTVKEVDALRSVVEHKWLWGTYNHNWQDKPRYSPSYREDEKTKCVEELVRTHMVAGHTAEDLLNSEADAS